jgi:hypothetical protein
MKNINLLKRFQIGNQRSFSGFSRQFAAEGTRDETYAFTGLR